MSIDSVLSSYTYQMYGGVRPDRKIEFTRSGSDASSIGARVSALINKEWHVISQIGGEDISVELVSNSEKIRDLIAAREGQPIVYVPAKKINEISAAEQDSILSSLEPDGPWRIEITNGPGRDRRFESVVSLCLFNPS